MNILIINHYAGSPYHGMEFRPYIFARQWQNSGHKVTIAASSISHLRNNKPKITGPVTREEIDGIQYIWLKNHITYQKNGVKRALNMFEFVWTLYRNNKLFINTIKPDLVIASTPHPFIIYPALHIAKKCKAKFVIEVRDLWPLTLIELAGISPLNPFVFLMQRTENFAYRKADKVVSVLPNSKNYMESHGMDPEKFVYIPNCVDPEAFELKTGNDVIQGYIEKIGHLKEKGNFLVGYFGGHAISNSLDQLIQASNILKNKPISFFLFGKGTEKNKLMEKAEKLGLKNIHFANPVSKPDSLTLMAHMDTLFLGMVKSPLYRFGISPNKLFDYMYSGKPIISAVDAEFDLMSSSQCGISAKPDNPLDIANAIEHLQGSSESLRKEMGERGKDFVAKNHNASVLADRFLNAVI